MRFVHVSDIHLFKSMESGKLPSAAASQYRRDIFAAFSEVVSRAKNADVLLISGDLVQMDCARLSDIKRIYEQFERIPDTKVFLSCGNHDFLTSGSLYLATARPENLFIFPDSLTSVYLEDINTRVWGFSWARPAYDSLPFDLPELNKNEINLMCLHGDALSARGPYMPLDARALARAGFDYAALGHIHKPQRINDSAFYAGSMAPLDFSETGRHGFFSGEADTGKLSVSFTPVAIREFEDIAVDVTGMESHAAIVEAAREKIKDPSRDFVRMTFTGARGEDIDISEVEMSLGEDMYCPVFADDTVADYDLDALSRENEGNVIGLFIQEYRQKAETDKTARAALYAGLDALLSSGRNDS